MQKNGLNVSASPSGQFIRRPTLSPAKVQGILTKGFYGKQHKTFRQNKFAEVHLFYWCVNLIHKLPFQKRRYEELGIDIHQEINKAWGDKRFGLGILWAGGFLWGGLSLFFFSVLMMLQVTISTLLIVSCAVGAGGICYVFVFRQDKYIEYFDKYEKWSKKEKRKYGWLTAGSMLFVMLSFYFCLVI